VFDAFGRRDLDAALAHMTEDVEVWTLGTAAETGRSEPYRGYEGMREYFADLMATWEYLEIVPGELRIAANGVVAFGTAHGRTVDGHEHEGIGVIWVIRLRDERVRSIRISPAGARPAAG
jgi:ketosteroid isomerase-like protein